MPAMGMTSRNTRIYASVDPEREFEPVIGAVHIATVEFASQTAQRPGSKTPSALF
jgi:hypothetical protein